MIEKYVSGTGYLPAEVRQANAPQKKGGISIGGVDAMQPDALLKKGKAPAGSRNLSPRSPQKPSKASGPARKL